MAAGTTSTWKLRRDQLFRRALNLAGVLHAGAQPRPEQIDLCKDLLMMSQATLQAEGLLLHAVERYTQTMTAGQAYVTATADTLDVEDGAVVRSTASLDSPIQIGTPLDYQRRPDKATSGQPTEYFPEKSGTGDAVTITVWLYPVPSADWPTLIYPRVRRLRDAETGDVDVDVPAKFHEPLMWRLASMVCTHYNRDPKAEALMERYREVSDTVLGDETQRGPLRMTVETLFGRW